MKLGKSSADSHVAKIRAKMASAEIKARQLEMEEEQRTKEFAKQLEIKHKIEQAGNVAKRIELEAKERRKTQEAMQRTRQHALRQNDNDNDKTTEEYSKELYNLS